MNDEEMSELLGLLRQIAANNERMAAGLLGGLRVLARDVLAVADAPGDPLGPEIVARARARAEKVLEGFGDDEHAH